MGSRLIKEGISMRIKKYRTEKSVVDEMDCVSGFDVWDDRNLWL
jgi:hypothetical protein